MYMNARIGEMLKYYRKLNHMSVPEAAARLKKDYGLDIAEKTIYGWESNQAHPTADTFVAVCEMYNIRSLTSVFPHHPEAEDLILTEDEKNVVLGYRRYPVYQPAIHQLLHVTPGKSRQ